MNKSYESDIRVEGDTVVKTYRPVYFKMNEDFDRHGEQYWYSRLRSDFFLAPLQIEENFIVLPRCKRSLGTPYYPKFSMGAKKDTVSWLKSLYEELKILGVCHHDIHPANIMLTKNGIKLIDLSWMTHNTEKKKLEPLMNLGYSTNDRRALAKIQRQVFYGKNKF